jgi:metallopeptidase MepB
MTVRNISNLAPQPPPRFTATPASLLNSAKESIIRTQEIQDQLVHKISCTGETASFATFLLPLAQNENVMTWEANLIKFYQYVSPNAELRTASREAKRLLADFTIETSMREDLFKLVKAAKEHASSDDMDIESQRLLRSEYRRYIANGLGLPPGPQRDRFKKISKRMSEVKIEFQKNLDEEDGGVWFTLQELAGVPSDVVERLEHDGEDERKVKVTYQYSDYFPVMDHAKNGETRKKLFLGFENKCQDNVPLFKEMIVLRDERARLLGYLNHAAYQLEDKMVSSTDTVNTFLEDLRLKLVGRGHEEIERLKKLKRANVGDGQYDGHYYLWDQRYYHRAMLEKEYMVDQQQIAEYFGLETTVERMMGIFSILFGLVFSEVSGGEKKQDCTWHPDVKLYHVWDDENQGGEFVGYLYLDLYSRHGKFGHPANFNIRPVSHGNVECKKKCIS